MDKEIKEKWIAALRSGDYDQCNGELTKTDGETTYCCLGVLAEITGNLQRIPADKYKEILPAELACGLSMRQQFRLIEMNDDEDKSFAEIADVLEGGFLMGEV